MLMVRRSMIRRRFALALAVPVIGMALLFAGPPRRVGEASTGSFEGRVHDSTGAPVARATVILRHPATGWERRMETDREGLFELPFLAAGRYELEFLAKGFGGVLFRGLDLEVGEDHRLDITLGPPSVEVVEAPPPLVEGASPALGDEIENRRISLLPLDGRQFSQLALIAAGTVPPYPNGATQQFNTAAQGLGFSVNGQRSERNNFSLDGITLMEPFAYSLTVNPSIDAIREFRVVENSYSVEQGVTSGAQVDIATRSGTNRFSGTAYEFLRNSALDARNFFDDPARPIPPYRQNQFGASFGGPLRRDRTFFFANHEGFRIRRSVTNTTLLPSAALRQGDFSGLNPLTGASFP